MTEVYVSADNVNFRKLDLKSDAQSIVMKYVQKDLQDISKVFAPYSMDFSFDATSGNKRALGFFGETDIVRPQTSNKYYTKIYTGGILNLTGKLQVKGANYSNNVPQSFSASFGTFMTALKDIIGDSTLNDLGSVKIDLPASIIPNMIQANATVPGTFPEVKWCIPFMSNNRVWSYDDTEPDEDVDTKDNIHYFGASAIDSDKYVNGRELRPGILFNSLLNMIIQKYNLDVVSPIQSRPEVTDAYVLCNNSEVRNVGFWPYKWLNNSMTHGGPDGKYIMQSFVESQKIRIKINPAKPSHRPYCKFKWQIENKYGQNFPDTRGRLRLHRYGYPDEVIYETEFTTDKGKIVCDFIIPDTFFVGNILDLGISTSWDEYVIHVKSNFRMYYGQPVLSAIQPVAYKAGLLGQGFAYSGNTYTSYDKKRIDLIAALPNTKVIDFVESYLKSFNVKIYDTSPNDNRLFWITPKDINTTGLAYSKATVDYTKYADMKSVPKKSVDTHNYYNFKHQTSNYRSNADYKIAAGMEYGQTTYPEVKPSDAKEYKVETKWSIIPPVLVALTDGMLTAYGFNTDAPTITEDFHFQYTPNYDELTLFYRRVRPAEGVGIAVVNCGVGGVPQIKKITSYSAPVPVQMVTGNSLSWSILVFDNTTWPDTLFHRGYAEEIIRLTDQNTLQHTYKLDLPPSEIYLNDATTIQGGGDTPAGFRLQNDIIIGETKFSIVDAQIDITTGKSNMTFLNY